MNSSKELIKHWASLCEDSEQNAIRTEETVVEDSGQNTHREDLLCEMANIWKKDTMLPMNIWIDGEQRVWPLWWSGEWWSSLPIRNLPTPLRRDLVLQPRRMRIRPAVLRNVARLAHRRKVLRREIVRTGKPEHAANLDRPPWPFGENRKNVVRHTPASALR